MLIPIITTVLTNTQHQQQAVRIALEQSGAVLGDKLAHRIMGQQACNMLSWGMCACAIEFVVPNSAADPAQAMKLLLRQQIAWKGYLTKHQANFSVVLVKL